MLIEAFKLFVTVEIIIQSIHESYGQIQYNNSCEENLPLINCISDITEIYLTQPLVGIQISVDKEDGDTCFISAFLKQFNRQLKSAIYMSNDSIVLHLDYGSKVFFCIILIRNSDVNDTLVRLQAQITYLKSNIQVWNSRGRFIIALLNNFKLKIHYINDIIYALWQHSIINLVVLAKAEKNVVNIYTAHPFSKTNCAQVVHAVLLDKYVDGSVKFVDSLSLFSPKLPKYFHNCSIKVSTFSEPPYIIENSENNSLVPYTDGIELNLINFVANVSGFSIIWMPSPTTTFRWGGLLENGTWYGIVGEVANGVSDVAFASLRPTSERYLACDLTVSYLMFTVSWFVPKAGRGNQWEIRVFEGSVWLAVFVGLILTSVTFYILGKSEFNAVKEHSTYLSLASCFLNSLQIALGITVKQIPKNTKLRFIFLIWVIHQIHINTAYTSSMVSILTNPGLEKQIETLQDLIKSGLKVCMIPEIELTKKRYTEYDVQVVFNRSFICPDLEEAVESIVKYKNFSLLANDGFIYFINRQAWNNIHILRDKLASYNVGMYLKKGCLYLERFNHIISRAVEAGLVEKWTSDLNDTKQFRSSGTANSEPRFLALPDLEYMFNFLFVGWIISTAVFIIELIQSRWKFSFC